MARRTWQLMVGSLLVCAVAAGCARTATTSDSMFESSGTSAAVSGRAPGGAGGPDGQGQGGWTSGAGGAGGPGSPGGAGGHHGVGTGPRVNPKEFAAITGLRDIHFDFDRYIIRPEETSILDANAEWLKLEANSRALLLIEGHADERGTNEYNLALGDRRARAAMSYLIAQGVRANRITVISYGEDRPVCRESAEDCWSRNRRAHFSIKQR